MSNNKLCNLISITGCAIATWHAGLMFFGKTNAVWGILIGIAAALFALFEYE